MGELRTMFDDSRRPGRIDIAEFRRDGYLQEVNRRFFHPLGLALEVVVSADGTERLGGVWDCRDDAEGIRYAGGLPDPEKAAHIDALIETRTPPRVQALGYFVQPIPESPAERHHRELHDGTLNEMPPEGQHG